MRKIISIIIAAIMIVSMAAINGPSAFAAESKNSFTLETTSNFFPSVANTYSDLTKFEDENGDVFVTVEYKLIAPDKYLINLQMDELTWDPNVLEFKEAYNKVGKGKSAKLNIFAFAVAQGQGTGVVNTFDDANGGRIVGNYTQVVNPALAYDMDDDDNYTPVTVVKAVFKVLDREATSTTVNCVIHTLSLDDDDNTMPDSNYKVVDSYIIPDEYTSMYTNTTDVTPEGEDIKPVQKYKIGDLNGDKAIDVLDATIIQKAAADKVTITVGRKRNADVNNDGAADVLDAADIQKFSVNKIKEFKRIA